MATVTLDIVENSSAEQFGVIKRHMRGGLVTGLDTTGSAVDLMWTVLNLPGIPRTGDAHPSRPEMKFNRIIMQGASGDAVRFQLVYETFNPYGPASAYYISDDTYIGTYTSNMLPGTRIPIQVSFDIPNTLGEKALIIPADYVPMTFYRPMRAVGVTALIYGNPEGDNTGKYVGYVNNATWRNLATGYWLMSRYFTNVSKFQGYYQKEMQSITRGNEDWSETAILQNKQTGRFANHVFMNDEIASNLSLTYAQGIIGSTNTRGFIRVGPYPLANFDNLFGFN